jgi:anaerobic sulfite reductase subunit A
MKSYTDLEKLSGYRASLYEFLSRVYREEIDESLLRQLKNNVDQPNFTSNTGFTMLREFFNRHRIDEDLVKELAADYADLFLGIGKKPAHPYESVYLSKEKIVMQEPRDEVLKIYGSEGLERSMDFNEPEDHVAVELEFQAYLCRKAEELFQNKDVQGGLRVLQVQMSFLQDHLAAWMPSFCGDIIDGSCKLGFYPAIAQITKDFINLEKTSLKETIKQI